MFYFMIQNGKRLAGSKSGLDFLLHILQSPSTTLRLTPHTRSLGLRKALCFNRRIISQLVPLADLSRLNLRVRISIGTLVDRNHDRAS